MTAPPEWVAEFNAAELGPELDGTPRVDLTAFSAAADRLATERYR